ncbi:MAG: glycoside hydrolase family 2 TIM barrel-domain containing protein [Fimbriimonas sp.]
MLGTLFALAAAGPATPTSPQVPPPLVRPVKVGKRGDSFTLLRDDRPYFIRGVGGTQQLLELTAIGGNSFRTWGAENLERDLAEAEKHDMTVCAGIWLGHKRHGFDYSDAKAVAMQKETVLATVKKYKDHPNLLLWGLGNEVELDGDDPNAWKAIDDLAKAVKELDPNHPTMTVIAEIGGNKIERLKTLCPNIDIVGINSYAGLASLPERLKAAGWEKPYIVTEFGPPGPWEVGKTEWGAPIEPTSSAKAMTYAANYSKGIEKQPQCLGGYAFLWGHKQEATATWFGMMLETGEKTGAVDFFAKAWGKPRKNTAPFIHKLASPIGGKKIPRGTPIEAEVTVMDAERDYLSYRWVIQAEQTERKTGGDAESRPQIVAQQLDPIGTGGVKFNGITKPGAYRLFLFVTDGKGNAATGNIPFYVE